VDREHVRGGEGVVDQSRADVDDDRWQHVRADDRNGHRGEALGDHSRSRDRHRQQDVHATAIDIVGDRPRRGVAR